MCRYRILLTKEFNVSTSAQSGSNIANLQKHDNNNNNNNINPIVNEQRLSEQQPSNNSKYNIQETVSDKNMRSILPLATNSVVVITYVHTPTKVFCRSLVEAHNDGYVKFAAQVFQYSLTAKPLRKLPQRNEIVLAKYENYYYRAMVLRIEKHSVGVFFMEFSNKEYIELEDLKEIDSDDIKYHSRYACGVDLCEIPQNVTAEQKEICVNYLQSLVDEPLKIVYTGQLSCETKVTFQIIKSGQHVNNKILELINKADSLNTMPPSDVSTAIKTISLSSEKTATTNATKRTPDIHRNTKDKQENFTGYFMKDIKYKELKPNYFELIVMDNSNILVKNGIFHAILPQDIDTLFTYYGLLAEYSEENTTPYIPKECRSMK